MLKLDELGELYNTKVGWVAPLEKKILENFITYHSWDQLAKVGLRLVFGHANFGLCKSGGLQLLDELGDENCLDVELSPKIREDAIVGDLSCSCWFIWLGLVFTNDDIGLDKFWYSELLIDVNGWVNGVFSENLSSPKFDVDMGALLIASSKYEQPRNVSSVLVCSKLILFAIFIIYKYDPIFSRLSTYFNCF